MVCYGLKGSRKLSNIGDDYDVLYEPGVYIIFVTISGPPRYVGRSDKSLYTRLRRHLNEGHYKYYKFKQCTTVKDVYTWECKYWHKYQETIKNSFENWGIHPARPNNTNLRCPVCNK